MEEFFARLNEFHKKYSKYFLMLALILVVVLFLRILPFMVKLFLPFIIAWVVSLMASPLVGFLKKRLHLPYKIGAVISVLLLLTLLMLLIMLIISAITGISGYITENFESMVQGISDYINSAYKGLVSWSDSLPFDFMEVLEKEVNRGNANYIAKKTTVDKDIQKMGTDLLSEITSWLLPFAGNVATGTISVVKGLPNAIIFVVMLMLSTYFFTAGKGKFVLWYKKNMSENFRDKVNVVKTECFGALLGMLKAQLILTLITAFELFIGLMVMGIENAALLAVIIAIVDMLPILGVGTVLIPWAIINILAGGTIYISVGMIVLYLICLCVRNILQPKIMGESIGISSLASLISIWVGYKIYGFLGMLLMPVIVTLIYKFYEVGLFDWFFTSHKGKTEAKGEKD